MSMGVRHCLLLAVVVKVTLISAHGGMIAQDPLFSTRCVAKTTGQYYIKNLEDMMNPNENPCDNFYQFACGNLAKLDLDTECADQKDPISASNNEMYGNLFNALNNDTLDEKVDRISLIRNSKNIYQSCKKANVSRWEDLELMANKRSREIALRALEGIGGWPALKGDSWNADAFDWTRTVLTVGNVSWWTSVFVPVDTTRSSENFMIHIAEPRFGLAKEILSSSVGWNDSKLAEYLEEGIEMVIELGGNEMNARRELADVLEFEISLARRLSKIPRRKLRWSKVTLGDLAANCSSYPWENYINDRIFPNLTIPSDEPLSVWNYEGLNDLLKFINATNKRILANFVAWREIESIKHSTMEAIYHTPEFMGNQYDDCWKCLSFLRRALPFSFHIVTLRTSPIDQDGWQKRKAAAEVVLMNVRKQLLKMVGNVSWLTQEACSSLSEKMNRIKMFFSYSPANYNDTLLEESFGSLQTNKDDFIESIITTNVFNSRAALRVMKRPRFGYDRLVSDTIQGSISSTPVYSSLDNAIRITLALMNQHFLDIGGPQYMNYGRLGMTIGENLGYPMYAYAIDLIRKDYYSAESADIPHEQKIRFIENQYKRFFNLSQLIPVNKTITSYIDLVDIYAAEAAYLAFVNLPLNEDKSQTLHGRQYSPKQMFWINVATRMCSNNKPLNETLTKIFPRDYEQYTMPKELRILGSFSNIKQFSEDFRCPIGSPMNPPSRTTIF